MALVEQWNGIERGLDPSWGNAQLALTVADDERVERAASLLGPANPGRSGTMLRLSCGRHGRGVGPEALRRLLRRLDEEKIAGNLELVATEDAPSLPAIGRRALAEEWDAALSTLPSDWSDLRCELELSSTDDLERTALLAAPINPARLGDRPGFRFRCARTFGYGASPAMVRRCLERLDQEEIRGEARIVHALSDTDPVGTQGPVWHLAGKTV